MFFLHLGGGLNGLDPEQHLLNLIMRISELERGREGNPPAKEEEIEKLEEVDLEE